MEKILIIRPNAIGDFILWLPTAKQYRQNFPKSTYQISIIANKDWSDWARRLDYWDEVIELDRDRFQKDFSYAWGLLSFVMKGNFKRVIYPVFSREFLFGDIFVLFSHAKQRIGFAGDLANRLFFAKFIGDLFFTRLIKFDVNTPIWEGEKNKFFIKSLFPESKLIQIDHEFPNELIGQYNLPINGSYVVLFVGSGSKIRSWPIDAFVEIANYLSKELSLKIIISGSDKDKIKAELIVANIPDAIDLTGKTTLFELASILKRSKFVIGNESAGIHLASALNVPSICVLGGGHFKRFMPYPNDSLNAPNFVNHPMACYNCNWHCRFDLGKDGVAPCVAQVKVCQIKEMIIKLNR